MNRTNKNVVTNVTSASVKWNFGVCDFSPDEKRRMTKHVRWPHTGHNQNSAVDQFVPHNSWHFPSVDKVFEFSLDTIAYRTLNDANLCDITYHHKYNNSPATKSPKSQGHSSEKSICFPQLGSKIELGVLMIVGLLLLRGCFKGPTELFDLWAFHANTNRS